MEMLRFKSIKEKPVVIHNAQRKLVDMKTLVPDQPEELYQFADYMSRIVKPAMSPENYYYGMIESLNHLNTGLRYNIKTDRYERVFHPLVGRSEPLDLITQLFPTVCKELFGEDFMEQVQTTRDKWAKSVIEMLDTMDAVRR